MKKVMILMALFALVTGFSFTSCTTEDPAIPVPTEPMYVSWEKTATIIGYVRTTPNDLDESPQTGFKAQPYSMVAVPNLKIHISIPYSELQPGYSNLKMPDFEVVKNWTTMVDVNDVNCYNPATGKFLVKVPVGLDTTRVTIRVEDYVGTRTRITGYQGNDVNNPPVRETQNGIWAPGNVDKNGKWWAGLPSDYDINGRTQIYVVKDGQTVILETPITFGFIRFESDRFDPTKQK